MWQLLILVLIFGALLISGWLFVNHNLYKDFEGKDPIAQVGGLRNKTLLLPGHLALECGPRQIAV